MNDIKPYQRKGFAGIIAIALGIVLNNITSGIGSAFMGVGALLFIAAFIEKGKSENE